MAPAEWLKTPYAGRVEIGGADLGRRSRGGDNPICNLDRRNVHKASAAALGNPVLNGAKGAFSDIHSTAQFVQSLLGGVVHCGVRTADCLLTMQSRFCRFAFLHQNQA